MSTAPEPPGRPVLGVDPANPEFVVVGHLTPGGLFLADGHFTPWVTHPPLPRVPPMTSTACVPGSCVDPDHIPDKVIVRIARDRDPHGDDLAELLFDEMGASFEASARAVRRAHAAGYLEYNELTGHLLNDSTPTTAGLALLD